MSFVNLAPIADAALVASAVARALGVRESGDLPLVSAIAEHLRSLGRDAAAHGQLRAGVRRGGARAGTARRLPGAQGPGDQPPGAAHLRRAGVPGAAAAAAGAGRAVLAGDADGVRVDRAVRPAGRGRPARLRADAEERRRGRRDLPPAGRPAAGDRAGRGAGEDPAAGGAARPHRTAARAADRRRARPAGAPADAAPGDQVELRPADAARAEALSPPVGLRRRLHARSGRGGLQHAARTWASTCWTASPRSSTTACSCSARRTTASRASSCSRRSASTAGSGCSSTARPRRPARAHAAYMLVARRGREPRDEPGGARSVAALLRRRARQLPRRHPLADRHRRRGVGASARRGAVPVLGAARPSHRGARDAGEGAGDARSRGADAPSGTRALLRRACSPTSRATSTPPRRSAARPAASTGSSATRRASPRR